jgi:hypothetical protein
MRRRQNQDCLSDLQLDRWLSGELSAEQTQRSAAHLEECPLCQRRYVELSMEHRRFADLPPMGELERPGGGATLLDDKAFQTRRERRSQWFWVASTLAAAGVALFVARPWQRGAPPAEENGSGTRTKGASARLGWVVRRGEHVFTGRPEQALRAGDALRFTVSAAEPVYVAVLGLDATGRIGVYHADADRLARVEAGEQQALPGAIELDAAPGEERLYGVFCAAPMALSSVRFAVERAPDAPALPEGCSFERWTLSKEER